MKLSRLYTNRPEIFQPIDFLSGLNVVMAEIRLPENRNKDTHNLGKTTLGRVLDFCFLLERDPKFFLFKHFALFEHFVFFLEIELADSTYLTLRRGGQEASKISFKRHTAPKQDYSLLNTGWDHEHIAFERARTLLDGLLDWRALSPWTFRNGLGYLLRSQNDFQDVFQLSKYGPRHSNWKPFLAHILGFNGTLVAQHYNKEEELAQKQTEADTVNKELGGSLEDISKIEGLLLLKQKEAEKKQQLLDAFDFRSQDKKETKQIVEELDDEIARLDEARYALSANRRKIVTSLKEDQILFDPNDAQKLFHEAGVFFSGQLKKDYEQLITFNKAITEERRGYLEVELKEIDAEIQRITNLLSALGKKRSAKLSFLSETDVFSKYKQESDALVTLRADIAMLGKRREFLHRLQELRTDIRTLTEECGTLQAEIESDVESQTLTPTVCFLRQGCTSVM